MKRNFLVLGLAVAFLLSAHSAFAQTTLSGDANATTTSCFDYYKFGSVQVHIDPVTTHVAPGGVMQFKGVITNENPYPIVDGSVYIKVFRNDSKNDRTNGYPVVDQFIAKGNLSLKANGTSAFDFNWIVPVNAISGNYQIATFFQSAGEYSLLGLTFTNDIVGNTTDFKVDGTSDSGVIISKDDVTVDGQHFMFAAFPPTVNATGTIAIDTVLINTTGQNQNIPVKWSVYKWDGLKKGNLIDQKMEMYTAKPGQTKVSFNVTNETYPVYYVVAEADYKDTKTILDIRFVRNSKTDISLMLPAVTSYPLKKDVSATFFSCLHALNLDPVSGGKLDLSIIDSNGNTVNSLQYNGMIPPGMMALKKDFIPMSDLANFTIKASLYQDGVLKDSASMVYDCNKIDASLCPVAGSPAQGNELWWVIGALIGLVILIGIIVLISKRRGSMVVLFILIAAGSAHYAEAKTVVWSGNNQSAMYAKNFSATWCYLFQAYGQSFGSACNGNRNTAPYVGTSLAMQVQYAAGIKNMDTGAEIADGGTVNPGANVRLYLPLPVNNDVSWFGTGAWMGSPYGYWRPVADPDRLNFLPAASDDTHVYGLDNTHSYVYKLYMAMVVTPPVMSISNLTGLNCPSGLVTADPSTGYAYYEDCVVTASNGSISPTFNFGLTSAIFPYVISTAPTVRYKAQNRYVSIKTPPNTYSPYPQSIPAQTITISLNVNNLTAMPSQGSCSGSSGSVSWTAAVPPPTNYSLKVTDVTASPAVTTSYDGITDTNKTFITTSGDSYVWGIYLNNGGTINQQPSSNGSFTCSNPSSGSTSSLTANPTSVTSPGSSTLTSTATDVTACTITKAGVTVDSFTADATHNLTHTTPVTIPSGLAPNATLTYTLKCSTYSSTDPSDKTATITVTATPQNTCSGNFPSNAIACVPTIPPSNNTTPWSYLSACTGAIQFTCKYTCVSGSSWDGTQCLPPGTGYCNPYVNNATGGLSPATFANVGQLVTWQATSATSSYVWTGDIVGGSSFGSAYKIKYSTIGNKVVSLNGNNCTIMVNNSQNYLPIINDPNFREF